MYVSFVFYSFLWTALIANFICLSVPASHLLFCVVGLFCVSIDNKFDSI